MTIGDVHTRGCHFAAALAVYSTARARFSVVSTYSQVKQNQGKEFAEALDIPFLETSAKTGTFVDTAFLMMAHEIKNKMMNVSGSGSRSEGLSSSSEKKGCC